MCVCVLCASVLDIVLSVMAEDVLSELLLAAVSGFFSADFEGALDGAGLVCGVNSICVSGSAIIGLISGLCKNNHVRKTACKTKLRMRAAKRMAGRFVIKRPAWAGRGLESSILSLSIPKHLACQSSQQSALQGISPHALRLWRKFGG